MKRLCQALLIILSSSECWDNFLTLCKHGQTRMITVLRLFVQRQMCHQRAVNWTLGIWKIFENQRNQAVSLRWELNHVSTHHACLRATDASSFQSAFHLQNHITLFSPGLSQSNGLSLHIWIFLVLERRGHSGQNTLECWALNISKLLTSVSCRRILQALKTLTNKPLQTTLQSQNDFFFCR